MPSGVGIGCFVKDQNVLCLSFGGVTAVFAHSSPSSFTAENRSEVEWKTLRSYREKINV